MPPWCVRSLIKSVYKCTLWSCWKILSVNTLSNLSKQIEGKDFKYRLNIWKVWVFCLFVVCFGFVFIFILNFNLPFLLFYRVNHFRFELLFVLCFLLESSSMLISFCTVISTQNSLEGKNNHKCCFGSWNWDLAFLPCRVYSQ